MRRFLAGMNVFVAALLALALAAILNYLAARWDRDFDWTRQSAHTLDSRTRNLLDGIRERKEKVRIATFFAPEHAWEAELMVRVTTLLDRYKAACPDLEVKKADIYREPSTAMALAQEMVDGKAEPNMVAVRCGDRRKTIKAEEMALPDGPDRIREFKGEDAISTALQTVLNAKPARILYATGHGERSLTDPKDPNGFQVLKELMDRESLALKEQPVGNDPLEGRWDLVIVGGPQSPWLPDEVEALDRYLRSGGRVLLMLDPVLGEGNKGLSPTGLEALAGRWGIAVRDELVLDLKHAVGRDAENRPRTEVFRTTAFVPGGPITRGMDAQTPVVFAVARPVEPSPAGAPPGFTVAPLVRSEPGSWAKRDFRDLVLGPLRPDPRMDRAGPHILGVQLEIVKDGDPTATSDGGLRPGGRAVVLGDADVASSQVLSLGQINRDLVFNAVYWLLDRKDSMGITAKSDLVRINLPQDQLRQSSRLVQYAAPIVFLLVGVLVWWFRRH